MRYTAKNIIERSLHLADISNTDFLTHEEQTQYLNDAWTTVFNWLINKGDSQFVKEVELMGQSVGEYTEFEIPHDLYIIKSIKNKYSGNLINRAAESEGINSGTYEVVNDRIRLYGVCTSPLMMTYWLNPLYITFPDKEVEVDLSASIIDSVGNTILDENGNIINLVTGSTLGTIVLKDNADYKLGNGHVFEIENLEDTRHDVDVWTIGTSTLTSSFSTKDVSTYQKDSENVAIGELHYSSNGHRHYTEANEEHWFEVRNTSPLTSGSQQVYSDITTQDAPPEYVTKNAYDYSYCEATYAGYDYLVYDGNGYFLSDEDNNWYEGSIAHPDELLQTTDAELIEALNQQIASAQKIWNVTLKKYYYARTMSDTAITSDVYILNSQSVDASTGYIMAEEVHSDPIQTAYYSPYYYTTDNGYEIHYLDYNGNTIYNSQPTFDGIYPFKDSEGNILYQLMADSEYSAPFFMSRQLLPDLEEGSYPFFIFKLKDYYLFYDEVEKSICVYSADGSYELIRHIEGVNGIYAAEDWDLQPSFYLTYIDGTVNRYVIHDMFTPVVEELELNMPLGINLAILKYGPLISNGTYKTIYSGIPDTEFNFPNELYISLLACDLALRYAMKMNANTDGLNNLYTNMQTTFMNSLSQDADYPRIKNVY